jgi:hypothetical protein
MRSAGALQHQTFETRQHAHEMPGVRGGVSAEEIGLVVDAAGKGDVGAVVRYFIPSEARDLLRPRKSWLARSLAPLGMTQ